MSGNATVHRYIYLSHVIVLPISGRNQHISTTRLPVGLVQYVFVFGNMLKDFFLFIQFKQQPNISHPSNKMLPSYVSHMNDKTT